MTDLRHSRPASGSRFVLSAAVLLSFIIMFSNPAAAYRMMIICPDEYAEFLRPLERHKDNTGMSTQIVTLEEIEDDYWNFPGGAPFADEPERIKWAIYDHYISYDIEYVMLVGDMNVFPVRWIPGELDDWCPQKTADDTLPSPPAAHDYLENIWSPSDFYYADILNDLGLFHSWDRDNNDWFGEVWRGVESSDPDHGKGLNWDEIDYHPDVAVCRVPADSEEEVRNYVAKVIRYEYNTPHQAWFENMTFSLKDDPPWDTEGTTRNMRDNLAPLGFDFHFLADPCLQYCTDAPDDCTCSAADSHTPFYWPLRTGEPTQANIKTLLENGAGFHYHFGHGSPNRWNGSFNTGDVSSLNNPDKLPVVLCASCSTSRYGPWIPYNDHYWSKDRIEVSGAGRGYIRDTQFPEPYPIQANGVSPTGAIYNPAHCMSEEFLVGSESGAIAYYGAYNTGEGVSQRLMKSFIQSYADNAPGGDVILGDMWIDAIEAYHTEYGVDGHTRSTTGGAGTMWTFFTPKSF